jgi:membrane protease YdiL (CAAX protease family)
MTSAALPNAPEALAPLVANGRIPRRRIVGMLALRSALSFTLLLLTALAFRFAGRPAPIAESSAWWLWFVTAANVASIYLMVRFGRAEGLRLRDIYFVDRAAWKGDLLWTLIGFAGAALLAMPPGSLLAQALWGDANYPNAMLFRPLPAAAVYPLFLLMPITQALAELPIYWGYVAPRLRAFGMSRWLVIILVGCVLSLQHMFFSFQLDWRYDLWLAVKFLPFALWTGFLIDRRPSALPYLMGIHVLLDASLPYFALTAK